VNEDAELLESLLRPDATAFFDGGGKVAAVISLDISEDRVVQVWVVLNPDKLRAWNQNQNQPPAPGGAGPSRPRT
jgi:RNA polymerase sigma-70 factor, ECF subfamily